MINNFKTGEKVKYIGSDKDYMKESVLILTKGTYYQPHVGYYCEYIFNGYTICTPIILMRRLTMWEKIKYYLFKK